MGPEPLLSTALCKRPRCRSSTPTAHEGTDPLSSGSGILPGIRSPAPRAGVRSPAPRAGVRSPAPRRPLSRSPASALPLPGVRSPAPRRPLSRSPASPLPLPGVPSPAPRRPLSRSPGRRPPGLTFGARGREPGPRGTWTRLRRRAARRGEAGLNHALGAAGTRSPPPPTAPQRCPPEPRPRRPPSDMAIPRAHASPVPTLLLRVLLAQVVAAAGTPERAYNLTWTSINFKTILEWKPKPTNYAYTVQISSGSGDWKSKCFSKTDTECDLTDETVKDVHQTYMARVLSVPLNGTSSAGDPPYTNAPTFIPYLETKLGQPTIQSFERVGTKLNVTVQDSLTSVRRNGAFLSLREVFGNDLSYTLYYWRATSTGKKTIRTNTNEFFIDVDNGEYCFSVEALIPSRNENQKSSPSATECTESNPGVFRETYFIVGSVVFVIIIFIIILSLCLYCCRKGRAGQNGKNTPPHVI